MKLIKTNHNHDSFSILAAGVTIDGSIRSEGVVRIDGVVNGSVIAQGDVVVGSSGVVTKGIQGKNITIGGRIAGSVKCENKLTLEQTSQLKGDISAKILVVEAGASFDGHSSMSSLSESAATESTSSPLVTNSDTAS